MEGVHMTCMEAQALITPFINDELDRVTLEKFIDHVESCEECKEELEVYYALLTAMKQLDEDEEVSADFEKELANKINEAQDKILRAKLVHIRKRIVFFLMVVLIGLFTSVSVSVVEDVLNISEEVKFNQIVLKNEVLEPYINEEGRAKKITYGELETQIREAQEEENRRKALEEEEARQKKLRLEQFEKEESIKNAKEAMKKDYSRHSRYSRGYEEAGTDSSYKQDRRISIDTPMEFSR